MRSKSLPRIDWRGGIPKAGMAKRKVTVDVGAGIGFIAEIYDP